MCAFLKIHLEKREKKSFEHEILVNKEKNVKKSLGSKFNDSFIVQK